MRALLALILSLTPIQAHHSFAAEFDSAKPVHLQGVITKFRFVNPHAEIELDSGSEHWWIEAASPHALLRRGVSKITVHAGMRVVVNGYQAKDGSRRVYGTELILADGRALLLNPSGND